jgi:glycosyltransferase involved in cell wall biosynthesis
MIDRPRLTVFMPCYNEEDTIERAIASIISQSFLPFKVIILENASTDSTRSIITYLAKYDSRIEVRAFGLHTDVHGNWRRILSQSVDTEYVSIRSANDFLEPRYFGEAVELLESDINTGLVYSHGNYVSHDFQERFRPPEQSKIDTRNISKANAAKQILDRYSDPFSLWGVYRATSFFKAKMPINYGADHVFMCDIALDSMIRPLPQPLEWKSIPNNRGRTHYDNWRSYHYQTHRGLSTESPFLNPDYLTPFTSMAIGFLELFSTCNLPDKEKHQLQDYTFHSIKCRFGGHLENEATHLLEFINKYLAASRGSYCNLTLSRILLLILHLQMLAPNRQQDLKSAHRLLINYT